RLRRPRPQRQPGPDTPLLRLEAVCDPEDESEPVVTLVLPVRDWPRPCRTEKAPEWRTRGLAGMISRSSFKRGGGRSFGKEYKRHVKQWERPGFRAVC